MFGFTPINVVFIFIILIMLLIFIDLLCAAHVTKCTVCGYCAAVFIIYFSLPLYLHGIKNKTEIL